MKVGEGLNMKKIQYFLLCIIAIVVITFGSKCLVAQTAELARKTDSLTLSIALDKNQFMVGQSPSVIVKMYNHTESVLYLHGNWFQVHIEGENGEPPTTLRQRDSTGKLLPGESPMRMDETAVMPIFVDEPRTQTFIVKYFYDLSASGKYSVYVEIKDPLTNKWLRTDTVYFEVRKPSK
jgi:hypothetical protein